jgi:uncharacterized membrane protein
VIRAVIRFGFVVYGIAWAIDRLLAVLARGAPPGPIESLVVIDAPLDRVWPVLADLERRPAWMPLLASLRLVTPRPVAAGTRAEQVVRIAGFTLTDPVTVTAFDRPRRLVIRHDGVVTGSGEITLDAGADGMTTVVRWTETLIAPVLPQLAGLALDRILGSVFQANLGRLRDLVEAG